MALEFATRLGNPYNQPIASLQSLNAYGSSDPKAELIAVALIREEDGDRSLFGEELLSLSDEQGALLKADLGSLVGTNREEGLLRILEEWTSLKWDDEIGVLQSMRLGDLLASYGYGSNVTEVAELISTARGDQLQRRRNQEKELEREKAVLGLAIETVLNGLVPGEKRRVPGSGFPRVKTYWSKEEVVLREAVRVYLRDLLEKGDAIPRGKVRLPDVGPVDFTRLFGGAPSNG
ncbi:MAG: hypothetical protein NDJ92_11625 [Thermoanaerobaculia bacterium]|nr:hypothetical protein [Thermoanaerobaculia bacterium]